MSHLSFLISQLSFLISYVVLSQCHVWSGSCYVAAVISHISFVVYRVSFTDHNFHVPFIISHVPCLVSNFTLHASYVSCLISHASFHMCLFITRVITHFIFLIWTLAGYWFATCCSRCEHLLYTCSRLVDDFGTLVDCCLDTCWTQLDHVVDICRAPPRNLSNTFRTLVVHSL